MVIAKETTLQELLEGSKQYRVPLYQRTYSWGDAQLKRLWDDVEKLAEDRTHDPTATHFIGSVVLAPSPGIGPVGVQEYLVVDGQQRLTTLTLLLCAIRDHRQATEGGDHRQRIDELFLTNKYKSAAERSKVVPTQADRPACEAVLDATPQAGGPDRVGAAYRHFRAHLVRVDDPDDPLDVDRIEDAVIRGLSLVSVTAQHGDNACSRPAGRDPAVGGRPYGPADDELRNSEPETARLSLATIADRSGVAGRSGHETGCGGAGHRSARLPGRSASSTLAHEPAPGRAPTFATRWSRRDREPGRPRSGRFGYRLHILLRDEGSSRMACGDVAAPRL